MFLPLAILVIATASASAAAAAPPASAAELTPEQYAKLPVCKLSADGRKLAVEPCRTAPARKQMPRRPVPQFTDPTPRMAAPRVTEVPQHTWAPTLTPATPPSAMASAAEALPPPAGGTAFTPGKAPVVPTLPPLTPTPGPSAPAPVLCGPGGCRDPASGTFIPGPAGSGISPSGRQCSNNGQWMTCQ